MNKPLTLFYILLTLLIFSTPKTYAQQISYEEELGQDETDTQELDELKADVTGEIKMGVGITPEAFYWKRTNFDLNERNFRILSDEQLNNRENTYDPGIYDRLGFNVDMSNRDSTFSFHTNITVDPWSFTGKTEKITLPGDTLDPVEIEVLSWSNTGYTVNQIFNTLQNGDSFALPELKIIDGNTSAMTVQSTFGNIFTIPSLKINKQFQPIREFWFDYQPSEDFKMRFFPMAYQDAALASDDPLHLSDNKTYWEESPWLASWKSGQFNSGGNDFTKGSFDDSLAFFTRDSDGRRLTALRGISFDYASDDTTIKATVASPKTLWQDYERVDSIPASIRIKSFLTDNLYVGAIANAHMGFATGTVLDAYNYVSGLDFGISPAEGLKIENQFAVSLSRQDITNPVYASQNDRQGNAYYFGITRSSLPDKEILKKDYYTMKGNIYQNQNYSIFKLYYARMDDGFKSSLSNYRQTRRDSYWSRHINFPSPSSTRFFGRSISMDELAPFAIGNGLDIGRAVAVLKSDFSLLEGDLKVSSDIRRVHSNDSFRGKNRIIEQVYRSKWTHKATNRLTNKFFFLSHYVPRTSKEPRDITAGPQVVDPFIYSDATGEFLVNDHLAEGEDPSLKTWSFGSEYKFTDHLTANGIWEYTNDFTAASDNYPRGVFNSSNFMQFTESGLTYRKIIPFLYNQEFFDEAPYKYHNVFRAGLNFSPSRQWNMNLDYTRNPNEWAGQIDDQMNHVGLSLTYIPTPKLGLFAKYTWSRSNNIDTVLRDNNKEVVLQSHHNLFTEARYNISDTENFTFQYGVGPSPTYVSSSIDPISGSMLTLDTQHIVRIFYKKVF